ncbi:MAG: hypothetical protein E7233_04225 [Lachnospiraceae bacterium]|nr:hypothetical protein [Lachnospiraceae bacterium]
MTDDSRTVWRNARDELVRSVVSLGFPKELGNEVARNLGSPKAMERMTVYLKTVKPRKAEFVVDEMLAIMSEIKDWRERKSSREANAAYNEIRYYGFDDGDQF